MLAVKAHRAEVRESGTRIWERWQCLLRTPISRTFKCEKCVPYTIDGIWYWGSNFFVPGSSHSILKIELKMKCLNKWKQNGLSEKVFNSIKIIVKSIPKKKIVGRNQMICTPTLRKVECLNYPGQITLIIFSVKWIFKAIDISDSLNNLSQYCLFCQFQRNWK